MFNFIILRAQLLEEKGRYAEAADFTGNVLDQLKGQGVTDGLDAMEYYHQHVNVVRELPALCLSWLNQINLCTDLDITLHADNSTRRMC